MMREKSKYFRLNRPEQFQRGSCPAPLFWDNGLTLPRSGSGELFSRLFDSGEKETLWYRLHTQCSLPSNTSSRLTVYCSETDTAVTAEGERLDLRACIASSASAAQKHRWFAPFRVLQVPLEPDVLLYEAKGRYLWFSLELLASQDQAPRIDEMRLFFGGGSWIGDLPELYQTQDKGFLRRYLAIFQTMYEEMEEAVDTTVRNYTAQQAPPEFLRWLSSWYCIREHELWDEGQLRQLLAHARELYQAMGTRRVMEFLCRLYLGEAVTIVEYPEKDDPAFSCPPGVAREQIFRGPYVFTVLVPSRLVRSRSQYLSLLRILDSCKPAYLQANVILISEEPRPSGIRLGDAVYLSEGISDLSGATVLRGPEVEGEP